MKKIQLLNKISSAGTELFDPARYEVGEAVTDADGIMVRSADMLQMAFGKNLRAIARAGAGVNNIPLDRCAQEGIVVFNTPGANANGVKELTIAALLLASRDITGGVEWVDAQKDAAADIAKRVEKEKSRFAGIELAGKTLGVIGLGAIGGMVANTARSLGMEVIGYDPYITVKAAWGLSRTVRNAADYDELFAQSDFISVHVPATPETKNMFCAESFAKMKRGVRIVNLSRADLVNADDMIAALASGQVARYVTDFPTERIVGVPGIVAIPHLGASTEESEDNCARMAASELIEFLENGNIRNSVNFPEAVMPHSGDVRLCILHRNIPNMLAKITAAVGAEGINVENMLNRSRKEYAYTILEINGAVSEHTIDVIYGVEGVLRINLYR